MTRRPSTWLLVAAFASAGAGLVHAAAAGSHNDDAALAWLFAVTAVLQLGWAALVLVRPWSAVVAVGHRAQRRLRRARGCSRARSGWRARSPAWKTSVRPTPIAAALAAIACVDRARGVAHRIARVDAARRARAGREHRRGAGPGGAGDGGAAHPRRPRPRARRRRGRVARRHRARARRHRRTPARARATPTRRPSTTARRSSRSPTPASPRRSGRAPSRCWCRPAPRCWRASPTGRASRPPATSWIGDGRRAGGYEHFVQQDYMTDGLRARSRPHRVDRAAAPGRRQRARGHRDVHPRAGQDDGRRARRRRVAHDVARPPEPVLGRRTAKLAGIVVNGVCRPGGTFRATAPMMHVWLTDPPCGPFAGVEGHGAGDCAHTHAAA